MCTHKKHPYVKPTMTVIPAGTQQYSELMQALSQQQEHTDDPKKSEDSYKEEETKHV